MNDFTIDRLEPGFRGLFNNDADLHKKQTKIAGKNAAPVSKVLIDNNTDHFIRGKGETVGWWVSRPTHIYGKLEEVFNGKIPEFIVSRPGVWLGKLISGDVGRGIEGLFGRIPGAIAGAPGLIIGNGIQIASAGLREVIDHPIKAVKAVGKGISAVGNVLISPFKAL